MPVSRGFLCILFGVAITVFAWFSPWSWPAWPAFAVMELFLRVPTTYGVRAAIVVLLIVVNVSTWSLAARAIWWALQRLAGSPLRGA